MSFQSKRRDGPAGIGPLADLVLFSPARALAMVFGTMAGFWVATYTSRNRWARLVLSVGGALAISFGASAIGVVDVKASPVLMLPWMTSPGPANHYISGYTYNCISHVNSEQYAIDFGLGYLDAQGRPVAEPVGAVGRGVVEKVDWTDEGGNYISILQDDGLHAYYGHLSSARKAVNDKVREGDWIAMSGTSAKVAVGPHLHFSLHSGSVFGTAVVPEPMGGLTQYTHFENYGINQANNCQFSTNPGPVGGFAASPPAVAAAEGWGSLPHGPTYYLDGYGEIHPLSGAPAMTLLDRGYWSGFNVARDFKLCPTDESKGYVLDGLGGVHAVGSAPSVTFGDYFGWDIARSIAILDDCQSGYVLDGWGGVHRFAANGALPPAPTGVAPPYWQGRDIARAIVLDRDFNGGSGYTLNGDGGLTQWGSAPLLNPLPDYFGWDIARAVVISSNLPCCSGFVLDGWGGLHPYGPNAPALQPSAYFAGQDVFRGITINRRLEFSLPYRANGYFVDLYDGMNPFMSTNCC